jgi:hypothetical protein
MARHRTTINGMALDLGLDSRAGSIGWHRAESSISDRCRSTG